MKTKNIFKKPMALSVAFLMVLSTLLVAAPATVLAEADLIPLPSFATGVLYTNQKNSTVIDGISTSMIDGRAGRETVAYMEIDFSQFKNQLQTLDSVTFQMNAQPEGNFGGKYKLSILEPLASFDKTTIADYATSITFPVSGEPITGTIPANTSYATVTTENILSNLQAYFSAYPDATSIVFRLQAQTVGDIFRFRAAQSDGNARPRLNVMADDSMRTEGFNLGVAVGEPANLTRITAENTYATDIIDLVFAANGSTVAVSGLAASEGSTDIGNVNAPEIAGADGTYEVTATLKNANGTVKATKTETLKFSLLQVVFDCRGGLASNSLPLPPVKGVAENSIIAAPAEITKEYCTFDGWYKEADLTTPWNFETDTVTENTTLYAKWIDNGPDADGTKTITKPSLDMYIRADGGNVAQEEAALLGMTATKQFWISGDLQLGTQGAGTAYREILIKYDLEPDDIAAILSAEGTNDANSVILQYYLGANIQKASSIDINAYLVPVNKVSAIHSNYPELGPDGELNPTSQKMGMSYLDAFRAGITAREASWRNTPDAVTTISPVTEGEYVNLNLTDALQKYFTANPTATSFGVVLASLNPNNLTTSSSSRGANGPKLVLPAEGAVSGTTPVNQNGEELSLSNIGSATKIILRDVEGLNLTSGNFVPVVGFYSADNRLVGVRVIPDASCLLTGNLLKLDLNNVIGTIADAVSAKIMLLNNTSDLQPLRSVYPIN